MSTLLRLPQNRAGFAWHVASNVRAEAARRGIRQRELAQHVGVSQAGVSDRSRGVTEWSLSELEALADLFGVDVDVLTRCPRPDSNRQPAGWLAEVARGPWAPRLVAGVAAVSA